MHDRPDLEPSSIVDGAPGQTGAPGGPPLADPEGQAGLDLDSLPVAGITRRRVAFVLGAILSAWIVIVFARQVGEATAATGRAQSVAVANATLAADVAALKTELDRVSERPYIFQQARAFGLGTATEVPFSLGSDAPPLADDAPGSAELRLGEEIDRRTPLESWLNLLFGPDPAD